MRKGLPCVQGLEGLLQNVEEEASREGHFEGRPALNGAPSAPSSTGRHGKLGGAADWLHMARAPTA